jgi:protein-L-isoaspartate O-methyltransferase
MENNTRTHYDTFLAGKYAWISRGQHGQIRRNREFFLTHDIVPHDNPAAIDLGAGCGFQSVPLAQLGFSVTAVDFSKPLLEELRTQSGALPIVTVLDDIRNYSSWTGRHPSLIVCMGDTITHLPSPEDTEDLFRQCFSELESGGRLILGFRDYSQEPDGAVTVIPVQRDTDRIFLCRLEYHADTLTVQDILYSRERGPWERTAGKYRKIRIGPDALTRMLTGAGFAVEYSSADNGMITVIAQKKQ